MYRVLVVDDGTGTHSAVEQSLGEHSIEVVAAASLGEAREALEAGAFQLVLSEAYLPDGDVFTDLPQLFGNSLPLLLMTRNPTNGLRLRATAAGFRDVIAKPIQADELAQRVSELIQLPPVESDEGVWLDEIAQSGHGQAEATPSISEATSMRSDAESVDVGAADAGISDGGVPEESAADALKAVVALHGVRSGILIDQAGELMHGIGHPSLGALARVGAKFAATTESLIQDIHCSQLQSFVLEYGAGTLLVEKLPHGGLLGIDLENRSSVARVQYQAGLMLARIDASQEAHAA